MDNIPKGLRGISNNMKFAMDCNNHFAKEHINRLLFLPLIAIKYDGLDISYAFTYTN